MNSKDKALQKLKDSGKYVSPQGVRYLSKKERAEKAKTLFAGVKSQPKRSKNQQAQFEREYQRKFGRAYND